MMHKSYCLTITGSEILPQNPQQCSNFQCFHLYCVSDDQKAIVMFFYHKLQNFSIHISQARCHSCQPEQVLLNLVPVRTSDHVSRTSVNGFEIPLLGPICSSGSIWFHKQQACLFSPATVLCSMMHVCHAAGQLLVSSAF